MKTKATLCALAVATSPLKAETVTDKLLEALAFAESNNNPNAVGKHGEVGEYQMRQAAVYQAERWLAFRQNREERPIMAWFIYCTRPQCRAVFAEAMCDWINRTFYVMYGEMPNLQEMVMAWNLGFAGAIKRGFRMDKMPDATRRLVREVERRMK